MKPFLLTAPILMVVFNRLETTQRVFAEIRRARPSRLFVAADGPRAGHSGEAEKCAAVRQFVLAHIDWPCEVKTRFLDHNLGCRWGVSSAVNWFFEQVEEGIVLEDDCLPHPDFFRFCQEMLERYRRDTRVMHIGGSNHQHGVRRGDGDYYFSRFVHIWGWASWRRAWSHYDVEMHLLDEFERRHLIRAIFSSRNMQTRWLQILHDVRAGRIDTWDFQWNFAVMCQRGLGIIPNLNLIENIGMTTGGTNTAGMKMLRKFDFSMTTESLPADLRPPTFILPIPEAENLTFQEFRLPLKSKIKRLVWAVLGLDPCSSRKAPVEK